MAQAKLTVKDARGSWRTAEQGGGIDTGGTHHTELRPGRCRRMVFGSDLEPSRPSAPSHAVRQLVPG